MGGRACIRGMGLLYGVLKLGSVLFRIKSAKIVDLGFEFVATEKVRGL